MWVLRFPLRKRTRLWRTWEKMQAHGQFSNWGLTHDQLQHVDAFLKAEFIQPGKFCHIIGSRNLYHRIIFGRYIAALEAIIYGIEGMQAVCANSYSTAQQLEQIASGADWTLETDHTAWDAHVSTQHLYLLNDFYRRVFDVPQHEKVVFEMCLRAYLKTRWTYQNGIKYTLHGGRVSGDVDTTLGNSLLHIALNKAIAEECGSTIMQRVKGDDSVICGTGPKISIPLYREYGFEVKPIWRDRLSQVEFCSSYITTVRDASGNEVRKMCRLPWKIIGRLPYTNACYGKKQRVMVQREKVQCEQFCNDCVPVLGELTNYYSRCGSITSHVHIQSEQRQRLLEHYDSGGANITQRGREDFNEKFGISISDQMHCERYLNTLEPGSPPDHWVLRALGQPPT